MPSTFFPQEHGGQNWYRRNTPARRLAFPPTSGSTPTVTDRASATTTLAHPKEWTFTAPAAGSSLAGPARIWGQNRFVAKSTHNNAITPDPTLVNPGGNTPWVYAFHTDAPVFELNYYGIVGPMTFRLLIDGEVVGNYSLTGSGAAMHKVVIAPVSGAAKVRRVVVQGTNLELTGVTTTTADTVWAPEAPTARVCFLTDSYGLYQGYDAFQHVASRLLGWDEVDVNSVGGTGYNNAGGATDYTFAARVADVISGGYDVVLVCGGINDALNSLTTQAGAVLDALRTGLPKAKIVVLGPWTPGSNLVAVEQPKRDAIKTAADARTVPFIDPLLWVTGTGHQQLGAPTLTSAVNAAGGSLTSGTYFYTITATDGIGETAASNEVSAAVSSGSATLTWPNVSGATGYKVYRGTSGGGENTLAGTVAGGSTLTFTDTGTGSAATPPTTDTTGLKFDGNADRLIIPAGTHPSPDGAMYLGARLAGDLASTLAA